MTFIRRFCLFLPLSLLPFLLSCSHPRVEAFESGVGQLTQDDMIRQFGYPQRLKKLPTGSEVWDYEFLAGHSRCVGYHVFFDEDRRSTTWEPFPCRSDR